MYIAIFLLLLSLILSISSVQTYLAKIATERLNEKFNTNLVVKKVDFSLLGTVELKEIEIRDHHKDTLIFVNSLNTSILNAKRFLDNAVDLGDATLTGAKVYMKTYQGETSDNMTVFLNSFEDKEPKKAGNPFKLKASNIYVDDLTYKLVDENKQPKLLFSAEKAGGSLQDFSLIGPNLSMKVRGLYFTENRGLKITNLTTDFTYSKTAMELKNTTLQTEKSKVLGDVKMTYKIEDFANFIDKVKFDAKFKKSSVSVVDIKKFYKELSGNDVLNFNANFKGTLNNFELKKINLRSRNGIKIKGDLGLLNSFDTKKGVVFTADIDDVTANYNQLKNILPKSISKTLPTEFKRLGTFSLNGKLKTSPEQMDATLTVVSELGGVISDLQLSNIDDIDTAGYNGEIEFENFDLGKFFENPLFGEVSLKGDVKGSGFKLKNINTVFIGKVSKIGFKGYDYTNLTVNGRYQNNKFNGDLIADDKNLKVNFNGLADLSKLTNKFDFKADITHLDLKKTNLFTRDSISVIKGKINIDLTGNSLDDMNGSAVFNNIVYTNQDKTYKFKEFQVISQVKDSVQTIKVNSKDIVEGQLSGKFKFAELVPVAQNALGSIYTNYTPYPVQPNQYIDFNFSIYNQIVEVFLPEVFVGKNTKISGKINSDKQLLKLRIQAPELEAYGNKIKKLELRTDNQNPLFNTHLTANELTTKYYKLHKLNLLNRTKNDTLFFKSVFKGGKQEREQYNLDFFYTINPDKKSVVGLQKSNFNFKGNTWKVNPNKDFQNKVTFSLQDNTFDFSPFKLISGNQKIEFLGALKGDTEKSLQAKFDQVALPSILPKIDSLDLQGKLSGYIDFTQKAGIYKPKGAIQINNFEINKFKQGDLSLNIEGNNSYEKYSVNLSLQNEQAKSISGNGTLDFSKAKPNIDFAMYLKEYDIKAFSPLGKNILSNVRGKVTGDFTLKGFLGNPNMDGLLTLKDAGLKFPYLNTNYDFEGDALVGLKEQQFIFEDVRLKDTKYGTRGNLLGSITHQNFNAWFFDIEIDTDNLLVLDTEETEESLYYGTGFLDGSAEIMGLTDKLNIKINGKTNKGTKFVVPLKDVETVDNYRLIHFKSERQDISGIRQTALDAMKGLSLDINLEVTEDAEAQIVIDKVNGSQLSGRGEGNLKIEIDTRGKFNMYGDLSLQSGKYDFKYGGIINKTFGVQKGGTISWNGSPFDADLNIIAVHKVKANPALILDGFTSTRNIDVDLITKITGGLFDSKQELDIEMPNVSPTIASELDFVLNRNNVGEKANQFVSLLMFGRFINFENFNLEGNDVTSTATNALSAAFSNLLNSPDGKFKFGVNYQQAQGNDVESIRTDDQVDVSVSTQISDRVLVNGSVGVPVGANTQTSIVGEVKVEVLLNEEGNLRGTVFNRPNDIDYTLENEGYTQGIGISYQVNFNNGKELAEKLGLRKRKKQNDNTIIVRDSVLTPHRSLINKGKREKNTKEKE